MNDARPHSGQADVPSPPTTSKTSRTANRVIGGVLIAVSIALWAFPSDVAEAIVKQRDILLGRYTVDRLTSLVIVTVILWLAAAGQIRPPRRRLTGREVMFRIVTVSLVLVPSIVAIDVAGRLMRTPRYLETGAPHRSELPSDDGAAWVIRHRPPNASYDVEYADEPPTARSYPGRPPGYPTVKVKLTTDARGYRNPVALDRCDVLAVGDSFTEGSRVDDAEAWPRVAAAASGLSVYNVGMSGNSPREYLACVYAYVPRLRPRVVICMIYEGNDFKLDGPIEADGGIEADDTGASMNWFDDSPTRAALKHAMIRHLGPINADAPVRPSLALSWMPVAAPPGPAARYYSFVPKRLARLYVEPDSFGRSPGWMAVADVLERMTGFCREHDARLVVVHAPSKPHVVMPLVEQQVSAEALHDFMRYGMGRLPEPAAFKQQLFERLPTIQNMLAALCEKLGIDFVATAAALRQAAAQGRQVYYTYDQHWTAEGHRIVADTVAAHLIAADPPIAPASP